MSKIIKEELENMTYEELNALNTLIKSIQEKKEDEKRTALVNDFRKAYEALLNNGYDIVYYGEDYDEDVCVALTYWDSFEFNKEVKKD
jgi:predicted GNAT superfamily acetyltransferase